MAADTMPQGATGQTVTPEAVLAALDQLSAECRQAVLELHFRRRTVAETAELVGVPQAVVIARSYHGVRELRDAIGVTQRR